MDFPKDSNGDVLRRMLDGGDDLSMPRDIDFSIVFPSRQAAQTFIDLTSEGEIRLEWNEGLDGWDLTLTRFLLPDHAVITALEEELDRLASPLGGYLDGWGCFRQT